MLFGFAGILKGNYPPRPFATLRNVGANGAQHIHGTQLAILVADEFVGRVAMDACVSSEAKITSVG